MAKTVRANQRLTSGGLVATKREINTSREGILTYSVQYVCLTQFAREHLFKFAAEMPPPDAVPDKIFTLAKERPRLFSLNIKEERGISYFDAVYSTASKVEEIVTESEEVVSAVFSEDDSSYTFDYVSQTVSVSITAESSQMQSSLGTLLEVYPGVRIGRDPYPSFRDAKVGQPFNQKFIGTKAAQIATKLQKDQVVSRSKSQSSNGQFVYQTESRGVWILKKASLNL